MDEMIKCPVCGEINSAELDYCQKCNTHLRPQNEAFRPGELPDKKKNTAELEPILPQWLRDAREQSRQTSQDDSSQGFQQLKPQSPVEPPASSVDLLAGLRSQIGDDGDDETPDWLASITGISNKTKKTQTEPADVHRVEMGGKDDFAQDVDNETPSWLANIQSQPKTEKDELTDWFKEASTPTDNNSDWLGQSTQNNDFADKFNAPTSSGDTPDWLKSMDVENSAKDGSIANPEQVFSSTDDFPSWLQKEDMEQPSSTDEQPAWLNTLDSKEESRSLALDPAPFSEPVAVGNDAFFSSTDDTPDWLKNMQPEQSKIPPIKNTSPLWLKDNSAGEVAGENVPVWLSSDAPVINQPPAIDQLPISIEPKNEETELGDIPSWLKAAAPQASVFSEPAAELDMSFSSDTPDWLSAFKSVEGSQPSSPFANEEKDDVSLTAPAFTENSFESSGDALLTEMPDWLSETSDAPSTNIPSAINNAGTIAAGELPSWVQAMRPVESSVSQPRGVSSDQTLESRGALAGLQGVLPSVPGYVPSSKPKAYSILLQATEEQKSHALVLEQILSAETEPQPIASYLPLVASRSLRWFITFVVFSVVATVIALHTQFFTMPFLSMDSPNELKGALDVAQNVPEGAPVLVVIDYRASNAAELEAAAAPMLDQMDLLRHPKLVFVSTNEIGSILTERLVSLPSLKDRYQGEGQFTNLGYLPGGELGIRAFVQNPLQAKPKDVFQNQSPLQPISIAQFVAVIVLTDNADSGRVWIEQARAATAPLPFPAPVVFVTSAQAGPMIQPYYASGQVQGIVNGLYGAAVFEQNNAGRPGTARNYWDAYSLGMFLAMAMLSLGGLWNLALGTRDRSAAKEVK